MTDPMRLDSMTTGRTFFEKVLPLQACRSDALLFPSDVLEKCTAYKPHQELDFKKKTKFFPAKRIHEIDGAMESWKWGSKAKVYPPIRCPLIRGRSF
jgi:hypothetical protein